MGIVVDLIIVVILAGCIITGIKKGLTGSIIKLVSFIVALVLAFMLYKPVAAAITKNTQIDENIQNTIIQTFSKEKEETPEDSSQEQNMPTKFVQDINSKIENETTDARNKIVEETAKTTTTTIISEFLKAAGKRIHLGGNIGTPLLPEIEQIDTNDVAVVELSRTINTISASL